LYFGSIGLYFKNPALVVKIGGFEPTRMNREGQLGWGGLKELKNLV
jgi:hypothetical protein